MNKDSYKNIFPNLKNEDFKLTSPMTVGYNCIAWAANDSTRCWWPSSLIRYYWPTEIPCEETLEAFLLCFASLGYEICESHNIEEGYQKVAIYTDAGGVPKHAARQLPSGKWTSKIGDCHDIEHTISGLDSDAYGKVAKVLKKIMQ